MRYAPTEYEWASIKPFLPKKPRGFPRVNERACSTARIDDPIDSGIADFLRGQIETKLLAHHPEKNPRTVCCCQSVAAMRASGTDILAPAGCRMFTR